MSEGEDEYDAFRCAGCRQYLVNDAYQCGCGDRLCAFCFKRSSYSGKNFYCQKCGEEIVVKDCFRDKAAVAYLKHAKLPCTSYGCSWRGPSGEYQPHLETCEYALVECPKDLEGDSNFIMLKQVQLTKNNLIQLNNSVESSLSLLQQQLLQLKTELNHIDKEIATQLQLHDTNIHETKVNIQKVQNELQDLSLKSSGIKVSTYNGEFIWVIPEVRRHRHEARNEEILSVFSAPFYTSRTGYKMCIRAYLNGDGSGKSTHISLFLVIMKGEYDALLEWPFKYAVYLSILNQDGGTSIDYNFQPNTTSYSFERPQKEMNTAYGLPKFAPQSILHDRSYVKDDTMFIKCVIDTSTITQP